MTTPDKDERLSAYEGGNFGTPLDLIDDFIVPASLFFVRSNGPVPSIDTRAWRMGVDGFVDKPLKVGLLDLRRMPRRTITAFLECAGNSRTKFDPVPEGTPWVNDSVGNATWSGTSLSNLLDLSGVKKGAVDVVTQGADFEGMQRGLPIAVARDPDTMLVWEMNGSPLLPAHGAPVRLLVPRWAGIASTKWLSGITVLPRPFDGFYNTSNYVMFTKAGEGLHPVREMPVKSLIASPVDGAVLAAGPQRLHGFAWSGYGGITRVEISVNGGESWDDAELTKSAGRLAWTRFEFQWNATPGTTRILSRASDERTLKQPVKPLWNLKGYQMNGVQGASVTIT